MTPENELAACKQALQQYRRAWRELGAALSGDLQGRHPANLMAEIGRKHNLPPAHDQHDVRRFNRDEQANLAHALMHLEANKIADASAYGGWYCGNKEQFIKRHVKAVAFVRSLVTPNAQHDAGGRSVANDD
jgi:hypothetical protein